MTDALVVFTPSGKRGRFALGTPVLTAARQLGVDIDCGVRRAGDLRAVPGDGGRGQLRQARHHQHVRASERLLGGRGALSGQEGPAGGAAAVVPGAAPGRHRHRRAGRQPGAQAGGPEARRGARDRARYHDPAPLCRGRGAGHAPAARRLRAGRGGAAGAVGAGQAHHRPGRRCAACRRRCARASGR